MFLDRPQASLQWLILLLPAFAIGISSREVPAADWYVATNGSDSNPGSEDRPFASLVRARDAIREKIAEGLANDLHVSIGGGTYRLEEPLKFGPQDGGTKRYAVTYAAREGERVVLTGGRPITGWQRGKGTLWTAQLPEVRGGRWWFRQLYVDGQRLPRGRFPQKGFMKIKGHSPDYRQLQLEPSTNGGDRLLPSSDHVLPPFDLGGTDTDVVVVELWSIAREIIDSSTDDSLTANTPIGWVGHCCCLPQPGMSVFLEHSLAFVQQPGQWYLDRKTGVLHYMGAPGENPNERSFVAPFLERLLTIEGTAEHPVQNLHFRNLEFAHSAWKMPRIGYAGIQACYYGTSVEDGATFAVTPAIRFSHSYHSSLIGCRLRQIGGSGIGLGAGCRGNRIAGCQLTDIGGNGVNLGCMPVKNPHWADWTDRADTPRDNEIANCTLRRCGAELWGAVGIFDAMTSGSHIVHNEVSHMPYTGISTGYVWNSEPTSQQKCLIAYNHIHDVMRRLYDGGAVYTLGYQPGSVIRGNRMHAIRRSDYAFGKAGNNGIFFDEGSRGFSVEDNIIYDTANGPYRFNHCTREDQTWHDNVLDVNPGEAGFPKRQAEQAGLKLSHETRQPRLQDE